MLILLTNHCGISCPTFSQELATFAEPGSYISHYLELLLKWHQLSNTIDSGDNLCLFVLDWPSTWRRNHQSRKGQVHFVFCI